MKFSLKLTKIETALGVFERNMISHIIGPVNVNGEGRTRNNQGLKDKYGDISVITG